ncbi:hypothetical protein JCGZ_08809 [Jatropha curcas]|uniref:Uncharacterized protein n=1 Tax=Jatropha curcas TaxID=180498 RepID=A0A067KV71_JATCU|nr:hypothetical protein JCGZ_08809 [Jatropha curcas]
MEAVGVVGSGGLCVPASSINRSSTHTTYSLSFVPGKKLGLRSSHLAAFHSPSHLFSYSPSRPYNGSFAFINFCKNMSSDISAATSTTKRLDGKDALITGGASGIGECTARLFVKHGAKVLIADVQDDLGLSLCQEFSSPETISYVHCDVSSDSDVKNAVDLAVSRYGKLDIMYNNAGIGGNPDPRILSTENEDFKKVFDVNVFGSFLGAKYAAKVMIPNKKGCILFTSSLASVSSSGSPHAYTASKHAVVGLAKNLSIELGQYGIGVNSISPFGVATPLLRNAVGNKEKKEVEQVIASAATLKEVILEPEDIANAALYLARDESKYVSGINLVVDGGFSLTNPSFAIAMQSLFS